jgi:hypothetical protein
MDNNLELELVKKYPVLLKDFGGDPKATCMAWGIECGNGWYKILDHLFSYLTSLMNTSLHIDYTKSYKEAHKADKDYYEKHYSFRLKPPKITIAQVKEKYGTLTVYYHCLSEDGGGVVPEDIEQSIDQKDYEKKINRFYKKIDFAISYAEYQSSITCEETGRDGKLYTKGWHRTMCDEIAIKNGYNPEDASKEGIKWEEL